MPDDRRPEIAVPGGVLVDAGGRCARTQRPSHCPPPFPVGKQRSVAKPGAKVEPRRLLECGRERYRFPDRARLQHAAGSMRWLVAPGLRRQFADECPGPLPERHEPLRGEPFIGHRHGGARHDQRPRQFTAGRQTVSGPQPPIQNRTPDLAIDLAAEVLAPDQADVKGRHSPPSRRIGLVKYARIGTLPVLSFF